MIEQILRTLPYAACQGLIWGVMALGLYITNKILDFADLTVDGSIVTGAAVCAVMMLNGYGPWISMLVAMIAGGCCGLITGLLHTVFGIPPILSGILTQLMLYSGNLLIMGKSNLFLPSSEPVIVSISNIGLNNSEAVKNTAITIGVLLAIVVVIIAIYYWFFGTSLGCSIRATGCNGNMSKAQGINTNFTKVLGLVLANAFVALAGSLLAQYSGTINLTMGQGAIVNGLAAIVIGDAIFSRIARNFAVRLSGVVVGSIIFFTVYQVMIFFVTKIGLPADVLKMVTAMVVALFLGVPNLKDKLFAKIHHKKNVKEAKENA